MHSDGVYTYSYDAEGNMTGVNGIATYTYNALNQRVETVTPLGTQQFLFYPGGQRSATLDASGNALSEQTYFGSQPVAFLKGGAFHYQQQDWLGTERLRTSATGSVEGTYVSLPFGDYTSSTGTDQDPSHFTGLDSDAETSTSHATFRQYASNTGTWMRPDPYLGSYSQSNPQSFNRYAYVLNNPLSLFDRSGLYCEYGNKGNGVLDSVDYDSDPDECQSEGGEWFADGVTTVGGVVDYSGSYDSGSIFYWFTDLGNAQGTTNSGTSNNNPCPATGKPKAIVSVSATTSKPFEAAGESVGGFIGSLFGPEGTVAGAAMGESLGSSLGIGLNVSWVPSTNSWYVGPILTTAPGSGGGFNVSYTPILQGNPNSIAGGIGYSVGSTTPIGPTLQFSPGNPTNIGIQAGSHTPVGGSFGYNRCVHNCGC